MPKLGPIAAMLCTALLPAPAAAAREDAQNWQTLFVSAPVGGGVLASFEAIGRLTDDVGRLGQLELRFQAGRRVARTVTLWAGYVHVATYNRGRRDGIEDQAVEQVNWAVGTIGRIRVASRTRLEQRFQRGVRETNWRLREQLRLTLPLRDNGLALTGWAEPFVSLNHTSAIQYDFDQMRVFAGVDVPLSRHADVETGYLFQYLDRPTGDLVNHIAAVALNLHF